MGRALAVLFVVAFFTFAHETHGFSNARVARSNGDIDNYIYGLTYSHDQVLAYKGDSKTSVPVEKEGKVDAKKDFIVITREKKTAQNGKADIGVVTANEHRTFPGALLLANQRLMDNAPDLLVVDRAPLTYTVNLPGLTDKGHFEIHPSFAEYQSAKENALKTWFEKYPDDHNVAANFQSDFSFAHSKEFLRVQFGLAFKNTQIESSIDFDAMNNHEKLIMIHKFQQIFFTVSVASPRKPSDLFAPGVTVADLKQKTDNRNPPVIVDSVSYGRTIYVKIETSSTDSKAKAVLSNNLTRFDISNTNELNIKKELENLNMQVFVVGGSTDHVQLINARTFKEINDVIVQNSKFSRKNLGYPVSYSAQFIKDNARAVVQMSTDYIETTRTVHSKGIIKIVHKGWFVMQWSVTWKEVNYDKNGKKTVKENSWEKNWQDLTAPFEREIELPGNAEDIRVIAKVATGLAWEWWRTVIDRSGIPLIDSREFVVWGTTLYSQHYISPGI